MTKIGKKEKIKSFDNPPLLKINWKSIKEVSEFAENIFDTVREPLIALDKDLRVVKASQSFYDFFKVTPNETIGTFIYDLGNGQWNIPKLKELLEKILPDKTTFDNYEVEHDFTTIGKRIMLLNARQIKRGSGKEQIILLAIEDITKQKLADKLFYETNRLTNEYLDNLFNYANVPIIVWDSSFVILRFNQAFKKLIGYDWVELRDKKINILFPKEKIDSSLELIKKTRNNERLDNTEIDILTKEKEIRTVLWNSANIYDAEAKNIIATIAQGVDITISKHALDAVQESENKLQVILESTTDGILAINKEGRVIKTNKRFAELLQIPKTLLDTQNDDTIFKFVINQLVNPETFISKLRLLDKSTDEEIDIMDFKDGRVFERYSGPLLKKDSLIGRVWSFRDISERKRAEDALKESEETYRKLFENHSAVKIILDPDTGAILDANDAATQYYGWTREEIKHMNISQINTLSPEETSVEMEKVRFEGRTHFEFRHRRADGSIRDVEVFSSKIEIKGKDVLDSIIHDITERKRAREALQRSEADLKEAQRVGQLGSWDWDTTTDTITWSEEYYRIFGFDPTQPPPGYEKYLKLYTPESAARLDAAVKESMQTGEGYQLELELAHLDDTNHWINVIGEVKCDDKGQIVGLRGTAQDITERKHSEDLLLESEDKYRILAESSPGMIFLMDVNGYIIYMNNAGAAPFNLNHKEIIGKHLMDIFPPDIAQQNLDEIQEIVSNKKPLYNERELLFPNGSIWLDSRLTPILNKENQVVSVLGLSMNITERKRSEKEISMLGHSVKSVNECISISDIEEKFIFVNESFLKTYGYEENELIGKHVSILRSQNNPMELVEEILPTTLQGGWKGELWNKRKDGSEFLISLSTSVINGKDNKFLGLVGLAIEITEQKRFEQELIEAKEKAESASKLKDAFIANISHEIRTPLNGILGMTSIIKEIFQDKLRKEDEELFAGVDFSSHRLIRTIDLILNYSRLQVGEFPIFRKNLSISTICQNLINEVAIEAKIKLLDLTFVNNCPESEVFADEYSITMAISNLLSNAVKYTDKGFITLILRKDNNDDIILDIKDTGIGISEEYLDKIFEPYRQVQMGYGRAYEGVGLGLALVKKILLLYNFRVSVESKKGVGTTFSINFGKGVNEIKVETDKIAVIPSVAIKPERAMVLIVEDDAINQFTIQIFLKDRYNSVVADSAENAMKILKNNNVDLILMDISIKGDKNGLQLTKELKASKEYSHIPVIVCTGHVFVEDRQKAAAFGCDDFLAKPFSKQEMLNMVDSFAHK